MPNDDGVTIDIHFPKAGVDLSAAVMRQPARKVAGGEYARSTPECVNVRGFDPATNRSRGGSRPGLSKVFPGRVLGSYWMVQELNTLVGKGTGGTVQTSQSGRVVTLVAVSQGKVFTGVPGGDQPTEATNNSIGTPPLNTSGLMQSAPLNQKLYFADGTNWVYYNPPTDSVEDWEASAGTLPIDSDNNAPRLICTWRGRVVLSGLLNDPQNWFMSKSGDATNFDYSPTSTSPTDAIAGNNSPLGVIGDVITALVAYTDDILVFGGDHTIYMLRGDPFNGGQIDLVSDVIGFAWGQAWTKDPYGTIYFVSNKMGIYTLVPGQGAPQRISQQIEQRLQDVNTGENGIRLMWDDRYQGLHVFITPLAAPGPATHWYYDQRSAAWFPDTFGNDEHSPLCCCTFDGNERDDRVPLIGSWDGYIRRIDGDAADDDGTPIESSVTIGPIVTKDFDELVLHDVQPVLAEASGNVGWEVLVGTTAEAALLETDPLRSGTWEAGRGPTDYVRSSGHAIYVRLSSSARWAMEAVRGRFAALGKIRRRSPQ